MMMNKLRYFCVTVWNITRRPPTKRIAWLFTFTWALALFLPGLAVGLNPNRGLDFTVWVGWVNVVCAFLDGFMLVTAIQGLVWIYAASKTSPGRGSTGE